MRKILSLLGAVFLSTTASASVIACGGKEIIESKCKNLNLKTFITNKIINFGFYVNVYKLYSELNLDLISKIQIFNYIPLKDGYEIKYYSDTSGQHEVTNHNQNVVNFYFTITASNADPYWEGTTDFLFIRFFIEKLSYIEQNDFSLDFKKQFVINKKYTDLNSYIIDNCNKFKNKPLKDGYEIKYYSDTSGQHEVTNHNQNVGDVYFTIKAANDDPNWQGETGKIKLELT